MCVETSHILFAFKYKHNGIFLEALFDIGRTKTWFPSAHSRVIYINCLVSWALNTRKWRDMVPQWVCWVHFSLWWQNKLPHTRLVYPISFPYAAALYIVIVHAFCDFMYVRDLKRVSELDTKETLQDTDCSVFKIPRPKQSSHYLKHKQGPHVCFQPLRYSRVVWRWDTTIRASSLLISNQPGRPWRQSPKRQESASSDLSR